MSAEKIKFQNALYINDNLPVLLGLNSESVDLIYLDPPFNSKRLYSAPVGSLSAGASFKDMWTWKDVDEYNLESIAVGHPKLATFISSINGSYSKAMKAYLTYMAQRIIEMYRVLKNTGSLYLHCDPTASHYLKIVLDFIFDSNNFQNEIIWWYSGWNAKLKKHFNRRHDVLLFYSKSKSPVFNSFALPWESEDEYIKTRKQKVSVDEKGNKYVLSDAGAGNRVKRFLNDAMNYGKPVDDVWNIDKLNNSSKEATGYPTQKPEALLERILEASSNKGEIVLDPFCGCATTCVVAEKLERKWIGIDIESKANTILIQRLQLAEGLDGLFSQQKFMSTDKIPVRTDLKEVPKSESVKQRLYKEQKGKCNACGVDFEPRNLEIDHIIPKSKGGGDYYENYQLLCGSCNRIKGDRPMEYLRMKIARIEKTRAGVFFGD